MLCHQISVHPTEGRVYGGHCGTYPQGGGSRWGGGGGGVCCQGQVLLVAQLTSSVQSVSLTVLPRRCVTLKERSGDLRLIMLLHGSTPGIRLHSLSQFHTQEMVETRRLGLSVEPSLTCILFPFIWIPHISHSYPVPLHLDTPHLSFLSCSPTSGYSTSFTPVLFPFI